MTKTNQKNKKEKNPVKILIIFLAMIAISGLLGYLCGHIMEQNDDAIQIFLGQFMNNNILTYAIPSIYIIFNVIICMISFAYYFKCKKLAATWDGEDEDIIDEIEYKLNFPLLGSNIALIANFLFFAVLVHIAEFAGLSDDVSNIIYIINIATFVLSFVYEIVIQVLVVELEKKLNPEKKGHVLDTNFAKDWLGSCDEAQKQIIYQASYKANQAGNTACMFLWILCLIGQLQFNTGIFPTFCVCCIWMIQILVYTITAIKLECNK